MIPLVRRAIGQMFKKPEGAPSSSQDPSAEDAARVRYTTAELKDALRPSSSSQPTPAAVRGKAARRLALSQQAQASVGLVPLHTARQPTEHNHNSQRHTQEHSQDQQRTPSGLLAPLPARLGTHGLSQFDDSSPSPSPSTSASMSQLSSPGGSQQGDSVKKKYRHRKKKHRPVTSALHGKTGASQPTKPKTTPSSQHSQPSRPTTADDHSDNEDDDHAHLKPSLDVTSTPAHDIPSPEVREQELLVQVQTESHTHTLLEESTEIVTSREAETVISSTRTVDSVLSPVQELYESGEDESDDSPTLPLPEPSAPLEATSSEEKAMYPEIESGQRIPESSLDAFLAPFEEQDDHFDSLEQPQELDFEDFASYPKSQGTSSPPPSSSPSSPSSPTSPISPAVPIDFKAGSPALDLGSVSQQGADEHSPLFESVSKEQSPPSGEDSDDQEVWHPSLQSVRSSNGSDSPSESEPGPSSMVTLEYDSGDEAPVTQAFSQRSESPPVTGTLFSLDRGRVASDRASPDREVLSGVRISTRSSRARSISTPEATEVHIPAVAATRQDQSNGNSTDVAAKGRRSLRHQRTPEPIVEIEVPNRGSEAGHTTSSRSLASVNIPTSASTRSKDVKNSHASVSKDQDDADYTAPDELNDDSRNPTSESSESDNSDGHNSDSVEEEDDDYERRPRRMTRARMGRASKRLEEQRHASVIDSPARRTRSSRQNSERRDGSDDAPSRHTRLADRRSVEQQDRAVTDSPSKRTRSSMRLRSEQPTSPSPVSQRVLRTRRSTRQITPTPAPKKTPTSAPRRRILTRGSRSDDREQELTQQEPVDGHGSTAPEDSDGSDGSDETPVLSRKRQRRAPPTSSSVSTARARVAEKDRSHVVSSSPSLRAATTPDLEMDQVIEDFSADQHEQEVEMTLQSDNSESDDEWDVRRLKRIWKKYNVSWPLRDRRTENEAKQKGTFQFVNEPYSMDFIFGTALPLPKSANIKLFGEV